MARVFLPLLLLIFGFFATAVTSSLATPTDENQTAHPSFMPLTAVEKEEKENFLLNEAIPKKLVKLPPHFPQDDTKSGDTINNRPIGRQEEEQDDDSDEQDDEDDDNDDDAATPSECVKPAICECGGIVNMTGVGNVTIQYRGGGQYKNNERCVWTIVPADTVTLNGLVVLFERQDYGNDRDGVIFYTWDGRETLNGTKITKADTGKILMFSVQYAFLYFSSDGLTNGNGFKVTILGMPGPSSSSSYSSGSSSYSSGSTTYVPGSSYSSSGSSYQSQSSSGDKRTSVFFNGVKCPKEIMYPYPPFSTYQYPYNGKASWVLQSKYDSSTSLKIQFLDTYASSDYLKIYQLPPYGTSDRMFVLEGSYSGREPTAQTSSTKDPRILLFSSQGSGSGRGFHLTWAPTSETR